MKYEIRSKDKMNGYNLENDIYGAKSYKALFW